MRGVSTVVILMAVLGGGSAALAQEAPIAHVTGDATADQIAQWIKAGDQGSDQDPNAPQNGAPPPRQVHGEVGFGVSNRGYGGYVAAAMPVGQASEVDVAVGAGHERLPFGGSVNPRSLTVGIYLDGRDVADWLSHDKCGVRHSVPLRDDPVPQPDGSCARPDPKAASDTPGG